MYHLITSIKTTEPSSSTKKNSITVTINATLWENLSPPPPKKILAILEYNSQSMRKK